MGLIVSPTKVVVKIKYVNTCQTLRSVPGRYKHSIIVTLGLLRIWLLYHILLPSARSTLFHLFLKDPSRPPSLSVNITASQAVVSPSVKLG